VTLLRILSALEEMPALLQAAVDALPGDELRRRPAAGGFAAGEQAWHLADLEAEGFGLRIERLLREEGARLPDFDGAAVAAARGYLGLDGREGALRFRRSREANLARLRALPPAAWERSGSQEGVGRVALGDLPGMMLAHDRSHARELADLLAEIAPAHPALPGMRALAGRAPPGSGRAAP
jgi:hypothetical protein